MTLDNAAVEKLIEKLRGRKSTISGMAGECIGSRPPSADELAAADALETLLRHHTEAVTEGWNEALEYAAGIAANGCLVPPDGGSPTDSEREMCEHIADLIRRHKRPVHQPPASLGAQKDSASTSGEGR